MLDLLTYTRTKLEARKEREREAGNLIPVLSYERKKLYVISLLVERREREVAKDFKRKRIVIFLLLLLLLTLTPAATLDDKRTGKEGGI